MLHSLPPSFVPVALRYDPGLRGVRSLLVVVRVVPTLAVAAVVPLILPFLLRGLVVGLV